MKEGRMEKGGREGWRERKEEREVEEGAIQC